MRTTDTDLVLKGAAEGDNVPWTGYDNAKDDPTYVTPNLWNANTYIGSARANANTGTGSRVVLASVENQYRESTPNVSGGESSVIVEGRNASITARTTTGAEDSYNQTSLAVTPFGVEVNKYRGTGLNPDSPTNPGPDGTLSAGHVETNHLTVANIRTLTSSGGLTLSGAINNVTAGTDTYNFLILGRSTPGRVAQYSLDNLTDRRRGVLVGRDEFEERIGGATGDPGDPGAPGEDGVGIVEITQPSDDTMRVHLSDGRSYTVTLPPGPEGPQGLQGPAGSGVTEERVREIIGEYLDGDGNGGTGPGDPEPDPDLPTVVIGSDAQGSLHAALAERGLDYRTVTEIPFNLDIQTADLYRLFYDMAALRTAPAMDTSGVTRMTQMFQNCSSLTYIPDMDTSEVTNTANMLRGTASLQDGYVRLIGMHPDLTASRRLSMITGSALTREPFFDTEGNPIP